MVRRAFIRKKYKEEININLSPFIDTLFVLLIVFMIPTQTIFGNVKVDLPSADAEIVILEREPIKIFIDKNAIITVNEESTGINNLVKKVNEISLKNKKIKIYVVGDKANNYGFIVNIVGKLNGAGFTDVVLISDIHDRI